MRLFGPPCLLLLSLLCAPSSPGAEQPPVLRLPDSVAPTSYRAELTLDPVKQTFTGSLEIRIDIKQPVQTIWLNGSKLEVQNAALSIAEQRFTAHAIQGGADFIGLAFESPVPVGPAELHIQYTGAIRQQDSSGIFHMVDNGNNYLFTQFESTDARAAFPCFDEPSYKVPWQLTLNIPSQDTAVSNTSPSSDQVKGGRRIIAFQKTKPLPSYLIAFAIGQFDFVPAGFAGSKHTPIRIVTPKGHASEAKYAAEITATVLTRLEDYFGIPFPYDKSDQVAIPVTFGFGAMENAGMVTYGQTIILADPGHDTENRRRAYASVAAHELAHQWFGDFVTTAWWNDIWLNEAFATWMEKKLLADWKPEWSTRVEDVGAKLDVEGQDSLIAARKIRQEIVSKDDISNAFDDITYQKGAAVIGMFEGWMGPAQFREGVHAYLTQHAFGNATAPEFLDALSSVSDKPGFAEAFSTFLDQPGVPLLTVSLECRDGSALLHLAQSRYLPLGAKNPGSSFWQIPICARTGADGQADSECTLMTKPSLDWSLHAKGCPAWVEANDRAVGYYRVDYQNGLRSKLVSGDVVHRLSPAERVDFIGNAAALTSGGRLPAGDALALVDVFHDDPERYVVRRALDIALSPYFHLIPDNLRPNYRRFLLKNFQARARQLGWIPAPSEPDSVRLLRPSLVRNVATYGGDNELADQGRQLADKWFTDRSAVDPNMVDAVLRTAAFYGGKDLFDRFYELLLKSNDRQERERIFAAMSSFRDRSAIQAGMQALLSGKIPFIEGLTLLFSGQNESATRTMPFDFMKAHFDEIAAKRPTGGGFDAGAVFPAVGGSFCTVEARNELQQFFQPRIGQFTGATRSLSQTLESIDDCIADKAANQSSVTAFLEKY